jgi:hypothetical protein
VSRLSTARALLALAVLVLCSQAWGGTVTLDFEGFSDSTPFTTQYPGLTFINATVLTAGIGLNEFEFPPRSGGNVMFDDSGPIAINFSSPILTFGGYFTYTVPLVLLGFDAGNNQVASAVSAFANNLALSGDLGSSPNEFLSLNFAGGISSVTITGDPSGGSFVMDDSTITSAVPEPRALFPMSSGLFFLLLLTRRRAFFRMYDKT